MTPTQAQIEAAAIAYEKTFRSIGISENQLHQEALEAALTAAAEVGEQNIVLDKTGTYWDRRFPNELIDHTIERCAQVAESVRTNRYGDTVVGGVLTGGRYELPPSGKEIAAALRALKDTNEQLTPRPADQESGIRETSGPGVATIERCAQVAEKYKDDDGDMGFVSIRIAAAIRALKEI